ncbi:hypothetical protein NE236_32795 [Actinoallomurus purpureus]|uniref:hypothetical protein n=1 Tax=Actinoallomurus purpureus TaxID=478114 RepID=UPI0020937302|nr:hypothetical protein [Actinoallomurus purpureus]MCO6009760.1 hypothetical protein [Actinoallomurus purpureus]
MKSITRRILATAAAAPIAVALTAPAAHAEPSPVKVDFSSCPDRLPVGADPAQWWCNIFVVGGGSMKLGNITQPLTEPMTISLASGPDRASKQVQIVTLTGKPMTVPGGALGIPGTENLPGVKLQAQPKYVGNFGLSVDDSGNLRSTLDLRIKLINALMGNTCYIGTTKAPIKLNTTVDPASLTPYDNDIVGLTLNDNAYSVPGASGCGLLTPVANLRGGLPSASGQNTASMRTYLATKVYTDLYPALRKKARSKPATNRMPFNLPSSVLRRK